MKKGSSFRAVLASISLDAVTQEPPYRRRYERAQAAPVDNLRNLTGVGPLLFVNFNFPKDSTN